MITEIFTIEDHAVRDGESGIIKEISWLCLQNFYGLSNTLRVSLLIPVTGMMNKVSSSFVHSLSPAFTQLFWQPPWHTLHVLPKATTEFIPMGQSQPVSQRLEPVNQYFPFAAADGQFWEDP